jgi:hypothetical protein
MWGLVSHFKNHSFNYEMRNHWRKGNREPLQDAEQGNDIMKSIFKKIVFLKVNGMGYWEGRIQLRVIHSFYYLLSGKDVPSSVERILN